MSKITGDAEIASWKPLTPHIAEIVALAPTAPLVVALTPHINELIATADTRPKYDGVLRVFWLTP